MDEDKVLDDLCLEVAEDTSITDNLLEYADREELDEFYTLLTGKRDDELGKLLRRIHRDAMRLERSIRLECRLQQAREADREQRDYNYRWALGPTASEGRG